MDAYWFVFLIFLAWVGWNVLKIQKKKREVGLFDVHITLENMEKMFLNGRERTYETPYGVLHVYPDPKHVFCPGG